MFNVTKPRFKVKTLKSGDQDFTFSHDGFTLTPRAGFQISSGCPQNYREIISECIEYGWLKPIAHMKESEFVWEELGK
jgi:hypothetical protein